MGKQNHHKMNDVSSPREFFLSVLTGGIPMMLIQEMCENIEIDKINTKEVGIDKYWLILREFAPVVADCLAFDQLVLSFKEFEDNEAIDRSELLPVSNKEAFSYLTQFRDDELRFALASLSDNPMVLYDLYNIIMDGEYEAYKQCLSKNNISTSLVSLKKC